ncbi:MAG: hypothetical protein IJU91_04020 [Selenomonadaceae bacterium]|nr:hypothetical protein [Selenomonadaceae bacterium]
MQNVTQKIIEIITANFPNGIRNDFIDINKIFRIYAAENSAENIVRDLISDVIQEKGVEDGGKFFFISETDIEKIQSLAQKILETTPIAYYAAVYEKHADFFTALNIFSPDVLKKFLQTVGDGNFYFDEFFAVSLMTRLDYEIAKIFMKAPSALSIDDLQKTLSYVPAEKISAILTDTKKYLPALNGKFIPISKIKFDTDEINAAINQISACIKKKGHAEIDDYDLYSNFALNSEVDENILRDFIHAKFFDKLFTKRRKKLFAKSDANANAKGAMALLRDFISPKQEMTVTELFAYSEKLNITGYVIALRSAYEQMSRVDKNLFVKDALIHFDVAGIDAALTPFVQGKIIPLRAVTSFTGFPPVDGYTWNLFLLESFLRKYSQKYVYASSDFNNASAGAIYPKSMKFKDYLDLQAHAVLQDKIKLEKDIVAEFLVSQGYRVNRIDKVTERIIARAYEVSEKI